MKNRSFSFLILIMSLIISCSRPIPSFNYTKITGVWIGKDIEIVRTLNYEMRFEKNSENETDILGSVAVITSKDNSFSMKKRMIVIGNKEGISYCAFSLLNPDDKCVYLNDSNLLKQLITEQYKIIINDDTIKMLSDYETIKIIENEMLIYRNNKLVHSLVLAEKISPSQSPIKPEELKSTNIASCLIGWNKGVYIDDSTSLEIETLKHGYIFSISPNNIYCGASRNASSSFGLLGNQNIRIRKAENQFATYMKNNNLSSADPLVIDTLKFRPNTCFIPNNMDESIYWSIKSISDTLISVHGCGGDTYYYFKNRYKKSKEWF